MAKSEKDELADALAALSAGNYTPSDEHGAADESHVQQPPPPAKLAKPAAPQEVRKPSPPPMPPKLSSPSLSQNAPRPVSPAKPAASTPPADTPRPASVAKPASSSNPARPAQPAVPSSRPAQPTSPPPQVSKPVAKTSTPNVPPTPPRPVDPMRAPPKRERPAAPSARPVAPVEPEPVEQVQPADSGSGTDVFDDGDSVIAPAPPSSVFAPKAKPPPRPPRKMVHRSEGFRQTLIPILFTNGVLLLGMASLKFVGGADSPFATLPPILPIMFGVFGIALLAFAWLNMMTVSKHLKDSEG